MVVAATGRLDGRVELDPFLLWKRIGVTHDIEQYVHAHLDDGKKDPQPLPFPGGPRGGEIPRGNFVATPGVQGSPGGPPGGPEASRDNFVATPGAQGGPRGPPGWVHPGGRDNFVAAPGSKWDPGARSLQFPGSKKGSRGVPRVSREAGAPRKLSRFGVRFSFVTPVASPTSSWSGFFQSPPKRDGGAHP